MPPVRKIPCKACSGTGKMTTRAAGGAVTTTRTCPHCKGEGWVEVKK